LGWANGAARLSDDAVGFETRAVSSLAPLHLQATENFDCVSDQRYEIEAEMSMKFRKSWHVVRAVPLGAKVRNSLGVLEVRGYLPQAAKLLMKVLPQYVLMVGVIIDLRIDGVPLCGIERPFISQPKFHVLAILGNDCKGPPIGRPF
jgi:hypothetical protein